jgi:hypothetical protein
MDDISDDLVVTVEQIAEIVCSELEKLNQQEDDMDFGADFMNDFATDDFVTKNIRVRPISGLTRADETRDGHRSSFSRLGPDGTEENEGKI